MWQAISFIMQGSGVAPDRTDWKGSMVTLRLRLPKRGFVFVASETQDILRHDTQGMWHDWETVRVMPANIPIHASTVESSRISIRKSWGSSHTYTQLDGFVRESCVHPFLHPQPTDTVGILYDPGGMASQSSRSISPSWWQRLHQAMNLLPCLPRSHRKTSW